MKVEDLIFLYEETNNKCYEHLLNAISDWPIEIDNVNEYYISVKEFFKIDYISISSLEESRLKIDVSVYSWELESLSELIYCLKCNDNYLPFIEEDI